MKTQLQLEDYYLTKLHIDWSAPTKAAVHVEEIQTGLDYDVAVHSSDELRYRLILRIRLSEQGKEEKNVGYVIVADIVGLFSFPKDSDLETREKLIRVNGLTLLYSTFRGILGGMTGMFPGQRLALPTIMPYEVVQRVEESKRAKRTSKQKKIKTVASAQS